MNDKENKFKKLEIKGINLNFGGIAAISDLSFDVNQGEILSIIGPNGAGKTSVVNSISGFYRPQKGGIRLDGKPILGLRPDKIAQLGIGRTFQNIELYTGMSTLENLMAARHIHMKKGVFADALYFGPAHREEIQQRRKVEEIIYFLELEAVRDQVVGILPYGQRKKVELGRALALEPQILLLDEPTAGMNLEEKEDMCRFILDIQELQKLSIILIEHDMGIVMDIADRIVVMDFGRKIAEGTPVEIKANPKVIQAYLGLEDQDVL
jgi:branched-chain amino acid transport system ATP-binding protein